MRAEMSGPVFVGFGLTRYLTGSNVKLKRTSTMSPGRMLPPAACASATVIDIARGFGVPTVMFPFVWSASLGIRTKTCPFEPAGVGGGGGAATERTGEGGAQ